MPKFTKDFKTLTGSPKDSAICLHMALFTTSWLSGFTWAWLTKQSGTGTGAVQRELAALLDAGLLLMTKRGNQKRFQVNPAAPVFAELRGLVLKTMGLADVLRAALMPLEAQISAAFVYGSVAKQQDRAQSDIDVLIVSESVSYADVFGALESATTQLGRKVNPTL